MQKSAIVFTMDVNLGNLLMKNMGGFSLDVQQRTDSLMRKAREASAKLVVLDSQLFNQGVVEQCESVGVSLLVIMTSQGGHPEVNSRLRHKVIPWNDGNNWLEFSEAVRHLTEITPRRKVQTQERKVTPQTTQPNKKTKKTGKKGNTGRSNNSKKSITCYNCGHQLSTRGKSKGDINCSNCGKNNSIERRLGKS